MMLCDVGDSAIRLRARLHVAYWLWLFVVKINGLMESWLIRRRGGKPMDKAMMCTS